MKRKKGFKRGKKFGICVKRNISEKDWLRYKLEVIESKIEVKKEEEIPMICFWEIMYQYLNPETSLAYPQHVFPKDKVSGRIYYGTKYACQQICNVANALEPTRTQFNKIAEFEL